MAYRLNRRVSVRRAPADPGRVDFYPVLWYNKSSYKDGDMMKKPEIEKNCAHCDKAQYLADGETMLCEREGVVSGGHCCRRFKYDPLKRIPAPAPKLEKADLSLE